MGKQDGGKPGRLAGVLRGRSLCLGAVAVAALSTEARAADYYVATLGSDGAPGSEAQPFRTITRAIAAAQPGDTVYVRGGTYLGFQNQINPIRSGTAAAPITIKAYPGELPVLQPTADITAGSAFEPLAATVSAPATRPVEYIVVEGFVARGWPSSGFSSGYYADEALFPGSRNITLRHNIADGNGLNGIGIYRTQNFVLENNITLHNGNLAPSWSSGINLFTVSGSAATNIVRGNVSFENIDICGDPDANPCNPALSTDGNGFILDEGSTGALFENNVAFRNGGSCIRVTESSGASLLNNTCFGNGLDTGYAFQPAEIYFSDQTSRQNVSLRNNIAASVNGRAAINDQQFNAGNVFVNNGGENLFRSTTGARIDLRPAAGANNVINVGTGAAPARDSGFDPGCIRQAQAGQAVAFWQYEVNYDYVRRVGGVAGCFRSVVRPVGGTQELGAYEVVPNVACQFHSDCDDGDTCTLDTCGDNGQCSSSAVADCCAADADCDDGNACTASTCNAATSTCQQEMISGCCSSAANCNDGNACTTDSCDTNTQRCVQTPISGCSSGGGPSPSACQVDADCNDQRACTNDRCNTTTRTCLNDAVPGCCAADADCNDNDACTNERCDLMTSRCVSEPIADCSTFGLRPSEGGGGGGCTLVDFGSSKRAAATLGVLWVLAVAAKRRRRR
jgi:parallel beta-helix repeat protein